MNKDKFIKDVLKRLAIDKKTKNRIREDLNERIEVAMENDPFFNIIEAMGTPDEVAKEFLENLDLDDNVFVQIGVGFNVNQSPYEYKSEATLFGLPLIHVNTGGRYQNRRAKGIIAVGDIATGVISIGGVSAGLVSIGGVGIGVIGIGGVGLGVLAIGGVAVGGLALGAVSIGLFKVFGALPFLLK